MTTSLHAHVSTASSDCDGPLYRDYILEMNDTEKASERAESDFKTRVLEGQVSFNPLMVCDVRITPQGFDTKEDTDEGYRSSEVRWCEDDCDLNESGQRDVFAEQMGY